MQENADARASKDHNVGSIIMLAVAAGAFLLVTFVGINGALFFSPSSSNRLKADWQRHVLASSGYLELGMFDEAEQALEEIESAEKTRARGLSDVCLRRRWLRVRVPPNPQSKKPVKPHEYRFYGCFDHQHRKAPKCTEKHENSQIRGFHWHALALKTNCLMQGDA